MRRPSRQGLTPVCTSGNRKMSAPSLFNNPDQNFCFPDISWFKKRYTNNVGIFSFLKAAQAIVTVVIALWLAFDANAQRANDETKIFFDAVRLGKHPTIPTFFLQNERRAFEILQPLLGDSSERVALSAYQIVSHVSLRSAAPEVRANGISTLMAACNNARPSIRHNSLEMLKHFRKNEFPVAAKDSLRKCIQKEITPLEDLIKMAGFLHLSDMIPQMRLWSQPGNPSPRRWAAMLSLARMGDSFAIREVMDRVKRLPVNDDLVYRIFPDLVYTRRSEAIAYMVEVLSNDQYECISADLEHERQIPCGYRVMEQLAPIIAHFPVQLDEGGDLATDDYPGALEQSQQWFMLNKTYTILDDQF